MFPLAPRVHGNYPLAVQMSFDRLVQYLRTVAAGPNDVLWQPGLPSSQNRVATWAEVMQFVGASKSPITIWVQQDPGDPPLAVPSGVYQMNNAQIVSTRYGDPNAQQILLADGAQLRNVKQFFGSLIVVGNSTGLPGLANDPTPGTPPIYAIGFGAGLRNNGPAPMIVVPPFAFAVVSMPLSGSLELSVSPIIVATNAFVWLQSFEGSSEIDPGSIGGDVNSMLMVSHNGNLSSATGLPGPTLPVFSAFAGFVLNTPWGTNGGSGPTNPAPGVAGRPVGSFFGALTLGCSYFDTSLGATGMPIWFDNNGLSGWADASGVPVP